MIGNVPNEIFNIIEKLGVIKALGLILGCNNLHIFRVIRSG